MGTRDYCRFQEAYISQNEIHKEVHSFERNNWPSLLVTNTLEEAYRISLLILGILVVTVHVRVTTNTITP